MIEDNASTSPPARPIWEVVVWVLVGLMVGFAVGGLLGGLLGGLYGQFFLTSAEVGAGFINGVKQGFLYVGAAGALLGGGLCATLRFNPQTLRKLKRFYGIKRGYWSLILLAGAFSISLLGQFFVNNRALVVVHEGQTYFPALPFAASHTGVDFGMETDTEGQEYSYEVNYRELKAHFQSAGKGTVVMPLVPYSPEETRRIGDGTQHPSPPNFEARHFLGTDPIGQDIFARLFYGFRITLIFALMFTLVVYLIGVVIGCLMGYYGSWVDLLGQRAVEVWQNIPFLYMVIIAVAAISDLPFKLPAWFKILVLLIIMVLFSWTSMTYYMRTSILREKSRDYVAAAQMLGASTPRIIFNHLLPNTISTIVTFMPFTVATAIISITALDYLGFGLPSGTPSWGRMLQQGVANLHAPWIVLSAFTAMVMVLTLVTFIGEAVREAFDPKKFTTYE